MIEGGPGTHSLDSISEQRHVLVEIVPPPSSPTRVEVTGGQVMIGKELNAFQELLKYRYFTCYTIGTMVWAVFYYFLWSMLAIIWDDYRQRRRQRHFLPPEDASLDLHLDEAEFEDLFPEPAPRDEDESYTSALEGDGHPTVPSHIGGPTDSSEWEDIDTPGHVPTQPADAASVPSLT